METAGAEEGYKVAENVGGGDRFDLIIMDESKSEQVGRCGGNYCRLVSGRMVLLSLYPPTL